MNLFNEWQFPSMSLNYRMFLITNSLFRVDFLLLFFFFFFFIWYRRWRHSPKEHRQYLSLLQGQISIPRGRGKNLLFRFVCMELSHVYTEWHGFSFHECEYIVPVKSPTPISYSVSSTVFCPATFPLLPPTGFLLSYY